MRSKPTRKRSKKDEPVARPASPPGSTWDDAEKLLQKTPPTVLGISRPVFLGLLGGLAALARDVVGDAPGIDAELRRVENVCFAASLLDLAAGGTTLSAKTREEKLACAACMYGYGSHTHPARIPVVNAPGGSDVRTT